MTESIPAELYTQVTLLELNREQSQKSQITRIIPEQGVLLEPFRGNSVRKGRFDFLVLTNVGKTIGFEVLSRPSQGKMKQKLSYAKEVDEFVFVIPSNSFELYRKTQKNGFHVHARKRFFSAEFSSPALKVWLLNPETRAIERKSDFCEVYNTKKK